MKKLICKLFNTHFNLQQQASMLWGQMNYIGYTNIKLKCSFCGDDLLERLK